MNADDNIEQSQRAKLTLLVKIQVVIAVIAIAVTIIAVFQIGPLIDRKEKLVKEIAGIEQERGARIAELKQSKAELVLSKTELTQSKAELEQIEDELKKKENELKTITPLARRGLGMKAGKGSEDSLIPEASLQAVEATKQILSHNNNNNRSDVTIVLYTKNLEKDANINVVIPALVELGFRIDKKTSSLQTVSTNAIWFGSNVHIDDVKLVAYNLIGAGVPIKAIRPFRDPGRKASRIEIGGDKNILNRLVLTVEKIREAPNFTR